MPTKEGQLFKKQYPAGTPVRLNERYLNTLPEKERKRYIGREGIIRGYRMQDSSEPKPIVLLPKFGRFKEEVFYEMSWEYLDLVGADSSSDGQEN